MITDKDIIKLKKVFATKDDLNSTNSELKKLSDKTDQGFAWMIQEFGKLRGEMAQGFAEQNKKFATKDDLKRIENSMATKSDLAEIMGELRAIREELTVGAYRRLEITDAIESHETRISSLENKLSFPE